MGNPGEHSKKLRILQKKRDNTVLKKVPGRREEIPF